MTVFAGSELETADLIVDAVYEGIPRQNGTYADPLNRLVNGKRLGNTG